MGKLVDIETIRARIKTMKDKALFNCNYDASDALIDVLSFLDTLPKEKPMNLEAEMSIQYSLHAKIKGGDRHAELHWPQFQQVAMHFFNLGRNSKND